MISNDPNSMMHIRDQLTLTLIKTEYWDRAGGEGPLLCFETIRQLLSSDVVKCHHMGSLSHNTLPLRYPYCRVRPWKSPTPESPSLFWATEKWGKMGKMGKNGETWGKMGKNGEKRGGNGGKCGGMACQSTLARHCYFFDDTHDCNTSIQ